jgi:hypothetical protein
MDAGTTLATSVFIEPERYIIDLDALEHLLHRS